MCVVGSHTRGEDIGATPSVVLSRAGEEMDEAAQTHARPDPPARQGEAPGRREPARRAGGPPAGWPSGLGCRLKQGDNGSCFKRLLKSPASICKVLAQCEMREADTC